MWLFYLSFCCKLLSIFHQRELSTPKLQKKTHNIFLIKFLLLRYIHIETVNSMKTRRERLSAVVEHETVEVRNIK